MIDDIENRIPFDLTSEEEKALDELRQAYDKLVLLVMQRELGAKLEIIDDEHIKVDDVIMDNEQFDEWLEERCYELGYFETNTHYMA